MAASRHPVNADTRPLWWLPGSAATFLILLLSLGPLAALLWQAGTLSPRTLLADPYLRHVLGFSLGQALLSTLLSLGLAIPVARALARRRFPGRALLLNNADWLTKINYIEFLRDIGRHFSVNRMLAAESYKIRLEKGLNFIEFNYMLLQGYDFLYLFQHHGCALQMGGNDQWGNMLAGTELIRKVEAKDAQAVTFPLITTSTGHKMGKTEKGTVWLDGALTAPYEYYQYWVNCDDADVERFLKLFTFLPLSDIAVVKTLADARLNMAKAVLAYEATKVTHGAEAARAAWRASMEAFHARPVEADLFPGSDIPREAPQADTSAIPRHRISVEDLDAGLLVASVCAKAGLTQSMSEAKRLIGQGGIYVGERQVKSPDEKLSPDDFAGGRELRIRKGKKKYLMVEIGD